jgi:hypothetical protein
MAYVLIIKQNDYRCSACGEAMGDMHTSKGVCPHCNEPLLGAIPINDFKREVSVAPKPPVVKKAVPKSTPSTKAKSTKKK